MDTGTGFTDTGTSFSIFDCGPQFIYIVFLIGVFNFLGKEYSYVTDQFLFLFLCDLFLVAILNWFVSLISFQVHMILALGR